MTYSPDGQTGPVDLELLHITAFFVALVSSFVAVLAFLPAIFVSWYAERRGRRSVLFYGVAGCLIGLVVLGLYVAAMAWDGGLTDRFPGMSPADIAAAIAVVACVVAIAGAAGGATYWAIAGRSAGSVPASVSS
jgi:MFS family permease